MGKEIAKNPQDKNYIKKVLEKYKSDVSVNQIFSWTIFSWSDQNSQITVDGEYGIMQNPFDLSKRDYVPESMLHPGQMFLGKPVGGSTSKKWMIPGGVSIVDKNQKLAGTITIGFEIKNLAKIIQEVIKNENVNIELIYNDYNNQFAVFNIDKSFIKIFSEKEISSDKKAIFDYDNQITLKRKLQNYPYEIILTYDKKAVSSILWEIIYSRLIEIIIVILFSLIFLVIIYRSEEEKRQKIAFLMQREVINKAKNEFILQVGHELRNFVSAIIVLSEIIKEDLKNKKSLDNEIVKEEIDHLDHINDISQELMSFVTDLVDLNKPEDGKFEVNRLAIKTDFEDMVDRSIRILKSKINSKNIIINTNFADNLISISNLDQRRIKQILVSIIGNAIKYSSKDSKVDIVVKNLDQKSIEIIIKDCGIGMDESEIKKALATYNFAEYGANNETDSIELKLPLVRFLIEKQNGTIEIKSAKNYGTEVKIMF